MDQPGNFLEKNQDLLNMSVKKSMKKYPKHFFSFLNRAVQGEVKEESPLEPAQPANTTVLKLERRTKNSFSNH